LPKPSGHEHRLAASDPAGADSDAGKNLAPLVPGPVSAVYLHAMTFVFLGMFVASSAGEILFNKEEADILLHRPVSPKAMLWAKIRVLVEVSLWLAGAFNLVGLFVEFGSHGNRRFPIAHLCSTTLQALFCTGCVVLVYQLCLRWFGRERLEGLMTIGLGGSGNGRPNSAATGDAR
jgi:hypothetical protein